MEVELRGTLIQLNDELSLVSSREFYDLQEHRDQLIEALARTKSSLKAHRDQGKARQAELMDWKDKYERLDADFQAAYKELKEYHRHYGKMRGSMF